LLSFAIGAAQRMQSITLQQLDYGFQQNLENVGRMGVTLVFGTTVILNVLVKDLARKSKPDSSRSTVQNDSFGISSQKHELHSGKITTGKP
jgi:hypothetical protein